MRETAEELRGALERTVRAKATICGSSKSSIIALPFGDALGTERDVDVEAPLLDEPLDHGGDARVHGAAQHEELAVDEAAGDLGDRRLHRVQVGVEVLVDRRADHDHDVLGVADRARIRGGAQSTRIHHRAQDVVGARLLEGHPRVVDRGDRVLVEVVERDAQSPVGEGEPQRETDMPAAPDDGDVEGAHRGNRNGGIRRQREPAIRRTPRPNRRANAVPRAASIRAEDRVEPPGTRTRRSAARLVA